MYKYVYMPFIWRYEAILQHSKTLSTLQLFTYFCGLHLFIDNLSHKALPQSEEKNNLPLWTPLDTNVKSTIWQNLNLHQLFLSTIQSQ